MVSVLRDADACNSISKSNYNNLNTIVRVHRKTMPQIRRNTSEYVGTGYSLKKYTVP